DPFHRWHLHAEWFDKGGLLRPGWNMVFNGTGADEHLANVTGLVALLRRGRLPGLEAPPRRESSAPVVVQTGEGGNWSREQMDYLAEKLAAMLWPMARAADHVNAFASMGRARLRMGGV